MRHSSLVIATAAATCFLVTGICSPTFSTAQQQGSAPPAAQANDQEAPQEAANQEEAANQREKGRRKAAQRNGQAEQKKKSESLQVRVFKLEHASPQEIINLIQLRFSSGGRPGAAYPGVPEYASGYRAQGGLTSQFGPPAGAGLPVQPAQPRQQRQVPRIAADQRSNTIFVRGTKEQIEQVAELVEALDAPAGELDEQTLGGFLTIPIQHAEVGQVTSVLQQLGFEANTMRVGKTNLILLPGGEEEETKQAREIIEQLDQQPESQQQQQQTDAEGQQQESAQEEAGAEQDQQEQDDTQAEDDQQEQNDQQQQTTDE